MPRCYSQGWNGPSRVKRPRIWGVKVTLTVEAADGKQSYVDAEGETYEDAKAAAEKLIPEGSKAIAIRTD